MIYSYTQISQYLTCPRRYRHRYLDGWKEKDTRAAMLFGRAFELALGAFFRSEDPGDVLFREWSVCKDQPLQFSHSDTWDRMLKQGIMLLTRFCRMIVSEVARPVEICRSNLTDLLDETNSSATLTASGNSTENDAYLNGRRPLAGTKNTPKACCR